MSVLRPPRHPLVARALADARTWCAGHVIDERPALAHAARVAVTLGAYVADPAPQWVAAALLHDGPDLAPTAVDVYAVLNARYGRETARIVRALQTEHKALDRAAPAIVVDDQAVLLIATADRIVAFTSLLLRARRFGDVDAFFSARQPLLDLLPHFRACGEAATDRIPAPMSDRYDTTLRLLEQAAARVRADR